MSVEGDLFARLRLADVDSAPAENLGGTELAEKVQTDEEERINLVWALVFKQARQAARLSLEEMGDRLGMTKKQIWNIENARKMPSAALIIMYGDALRIAPERLVRRVKAY